MAQLPLDLPVRQRFGLEDFLVSGCNEAAFRFIGSWPGWMDRVALLLGPEGCGKSHLAAIWAASSGAEALEAITAAPPAANVLLEDVDREPRDEAALFHLLNRTREGGGFALLTARKGPGAWGLRTADLLSRLRLAPALSIAAPDDALLRALFVKMFDDRQITVEPAVLDYLALRVERSFAACRLVVERLDRAGLALGRRITKAVVARVLDAHPEMAADPEFPAAASW